MYIYELPTVMIRCLILTILMEVIAGFIIGIKSKKDFLNIALVNIITNPLVVSISVYYNFYYGLSARNNSLIVLELLAFLVEGLIYYKFMEYKRINGFLISLILNLSSYLFGILIN